MITQIFGIPRVGKTALMTKFALDRIKGRNARIDVQNAKKEIVEFNRGGFRLTAEFPHLVFSDYKIAARHGTIRSWDLDGFDFGLPDPNHTTAFLPPYSNMFFDEAQKYLNSRKTNIADSVSRAYEFHGHNHYNITLVSQRAKLIDLNVRELAQKVIEVVELEHKYDHGVIVGSTWYCREYDNAATALKSIDGQKVDYELVYYTFEGNIFRHYDSHFQKYSFYNGRYDSDFTLIDNADYKKTLEDVARFNREHGYNIPHGYYKKGD